MKFILPTTTILALVVFAGCSQPSVLEGILFTYAAEREPEDATDWIGTVSPTQPRRIFNSDSFWHTYAELNPNLSNSQIQATRLKFRLRRVEKFAFHESWVA